VGKDFKRYKFILSFIHSFTHSIIYSFTHSIILSFYHSIILSFYHSIILSFYHSIILSFYHSVILSFTHSIILSFTHSLYTLPLKLLFLCLRTDVLLVHKELPSFLLRDRLGNHNKLGNYILQRLLE
jgi:hypothetical protein